MPGEGVKGFGFEGRVPRSWPGGRGGRARALMPGKGSGTGGLAGGGQGLGGVQGLRFRGG